MSRITKTCLWATLAAVILVPCLILLGLYISVPRSEIERLKEGYVSIQRETPVVYSIVDVRPAEWVSLQEIDQKIVMAFVISEDWAFYEHRGVDWQQIQKALEDSFKNGNRLRGASTISQQVSKNLFLSPERSFFRKLRELFITHRLEMSLSKDKILEVYLNMVHLGEGIYGLSQASDYYFKTTPAGLNVREAAFLAMLLPSPVRYAQSYHDRKLSEYAQQTVESILEKLRVQGTLDAEESSHARSAPLRFDGRDPRRVTRPTAAKKVPSLLPLDDDGRAFERRYQMDEELMLGTSPSFDPNALDVPEIDLETEFSLE